jgi:hypothetical protein
MNPLNSVLEVGAAATDALSATRGAVEFNGDESLHPTTTQHRAVISTALTAAFTTVRLAFIWSPSKELLVVGLLERAQIAKKHD